MASVLQPSRSVVAPWEKQQQQRDAPKIKKPKRKEQQTMASLTALWPGHERSRSRSRSRSPATGEGIAKGNNAKRKAKGKGKKPSLGNSVDVTTAEEAVHSVQQAETPPERQKQRQPPSPPPSRPTDRATASRTSQRAPLHNTQASQGASKAQRHLSSFHGPVLADPDLDSSTTRQPLPVMDSSAPRDQPTPGKRPSDASEVSAESSAKLSSASAVSPLCDSFNNPIWPANSENLRSPPGQEHFVSPLESQPSISRRGFFPAPSSIQRVPSSAFSRGSPGSRSKGYAPGRAASTATNRGSLTSKYNPKQTWGEKGLATSFVEDNDNPYTLISPGIAGVFDDDTPTLTRAPTFRRQLTMEESRKKPLPPDPQVSPVRPLGRSASSSARQPSQSDEQPSDSSPRSPFLPRNPLPSDLGSLDDAFSPYGLYIQQQQQQLRRPRSQAESEPEPEAEAASQPEPQPQLEPQTEPEPEFPDPKAESKPEAAPVAEPQPQPLSQPESESQRQSPPEREQSDSQYSSWLMMDFEDSVDTEDNVDNQGHLETHLSNLTSPSSSASSSPSPTPTSTPQPSVPTETPQPAPGRGRMASPTPAPDQKPESQKVGSQRKKRPFDFESLRALRAQAAEKVQANSRFRSSKQNMNRGAPAQPQQERPDNEPSPKIISPPSVQRHGPQSQTANPALSERVNRTLSFARSRRGAERNLRLRLPRLMTTELSSSHDRNNLSVVVESPAELDSKCIKNASASASTSISTTPKEGSNQPTATEKIVSALLSSLHDQEPQRQSPLRSLESVSEEGPAAGAGIPPSLASTSTAEAERETCEGLSEQNARSTSSATPREIPIYAAEDIILRIMEHVDNLEDLFSLAVINRGFYRVLKQHELPLIKNTLYRMSPPAWELREMSPPWDNDELCSGTVELPVPEYTAELYMRHYTRDLCTMIALKSLVLVHCESFLRPETARGLAGLDEARSAEIDDAFWRVWTFCRIFGCGKSREEDIPAQADWLSGGRLAEHESRSAGVPVMHGASDGANSVLSDPPPGFSKGNPHGLTEKQLHDMMEIWTCLGVLLQVFHGKCVEARAYGVFDDMDIEEGDVAREAAAIEGWTQYLLTLGPSAILTLVSMNTSSPIASMFERAQSLGWTKWKSPTTAESGSCRWFLKEAISRVFNYQLVKPESSTHLLPSTSRTSKSSSARSRSTSPAKSSQSSVSDDPNAPNRQRQADFAVELRKKRRDPLDSGADGVDLTTPSNPASKERPISSFQQVVTKLDGLSDFSPSPTSADPFGPGSSSNISNHSNKNNSSWRNAYGDDDDDSPYQMTASALPRRFHTTRPTVEEKISQGRHPHYKEAPPAPTPTAILDPADIALNKMVKELGFKEKDAKWALKNTDTGESLNVEAAIDLLLQKAAEEGDETESFGGSETATELGRSKTTSGIPSDSEPAYRPAWRWG